MRFGLLALVSQQSRKQQRHIMSMAQVVVDPFCFRQFEEGSGKTPFIDMSIANFEKKVNEVYDEKKLKEGYAPFCKHLFVKNFVSCPANTLRITPWNEQYLQTGYSSRADYELPVRSLPFS